MKKIFLTIVAIILLLGALAGAGYAGYRIGYNNGARSTGNPPLVDRFERFGQDRMPMHSFGKDFDHGFNRGFGPGSFGMMHRDMEFGFFPIFAFLARIAVLGLIVWLIYLLITRSGWKLSLARQEVESTSAKTDPEIKTP